MPVWAADGPGRDAAAGSAQEVVLQCRRLRSCGGRLQAVRLPLCNRGQELTHTHVLQLHDRLQEAVIFLIER